METQRSYSSEEIQNWLVSWITKELKTTPEEVPVDEQFVNLGLQSRSVIVLIGDLEDMLGYEVDPAWAWDYPTIALLAERLAS